MDAKERLISGYRGYIPEDILKTFLSEINLNANQIIAYPPNPTFAIKMERKLISVGYYEEPVGLDIIIDEFDEDEITAETRSASITIGRPTNQQWKDLDIRGIVDSQNGRKGYLLTIKVEINEFNRKCYDKVRKAKPTWSCIVKPDYRNFYFFDPNPTSDIEIAKIANEVVKKGIKKFLEEIDIKSNGQIVLQTTKDQTYGQTHKKLSVADKEELQNIKELLKDASIGLSVEQEEAMTAAYIKRR